MDSGFGWLSKRTREIEDSARTLCCAFVRGALPPLDGEGGLSAAKVGWGAREMRGRKAQLARQHSSCASLPFTARTPHPSRLRRATLPIEGRES